MTDRPRQAPSPEVHARVEHLLERGALQEARQVLGAHAREVGLDSRGWNLTARLARALGHPAEEKQALEHALATAAHDAASWRRLAMLRSMLGETGAAVAAWRRAVAAAAEDAEVHEGLARALLAHQDLAGARDAVAALARRFPEQAGTHLLEGHLARADGRLAAAVDHYARAADLDPTAGEALWGLADLGAARAGDPAAQRALALLEDPGAPTADRVNAGFALGRVLDRAGRWRKAFETYAGANALAREALARHGIRYLPEAAARRVDELVEQLPAQAFTQPLPPLPIELEPVFVLGLPRSGTTLIEQILAAHSRVQAGGELLLGPACWHEFAAERARSGRSGPVDPSDPTDRALLESARERYVDGLFERDLDGPVVVDKLPANFEIAGFLRLLFPQAAVVHTRRDPRATGWSLFSANFAGHEPWYHDLADIAHYHGCYRRLVAHWRRVLPAPFVEVRYERLVREGESEIRGLLEAVGLAFEPACLRFHAQTRPILTASSAQVRQPLYRHAEDHWRHYEPWLGPVARLEDDEADGT